MKKVTKIAPAVVLALVLVACGAAVENNNANATAQDHWLDGKVETVLLLNTSLNSFNIHTSVQDGKVTLTGKVSNDVQKDLAGELAENVQGVKNVDNQLSVTSDAALSQQVATALTDTKIATVINSRLMLNPDVDASGIHVTVSNGDVTLTGTVSSNKMDDLVVALVKSTQDVKNVTDNMQVVAPASQVASQ